jgi:hypothetical protein
MTAWPAKITQSPQRPARLAVSDAWTWYKEQISKPPAGNGILAGLKIVLELLLVLDCPIIWLSG